MNLPLWVLQLAETFWQRAEVREPFPRSLRQPIARGWPMMVNSLPQLGLEKLRDWLAAQGIHWADGVAPCRLHACLFAWRGWGYVFLDGADPEDEQRFSLAHELAHFLRHYWQPREDAVQRHGKEVLEVLDTSRPPSLDERIDALLGGTALGCHVHLLRRDPNGGATAGTIDAAETEADRLAYELLAPAEEVLSLLGPRRGPADRAVLADRLRHGFGLPAVAAARYSAVLLPEPAQDPLLRSLGLQF